jgi:hypothetical protein
MPWPDNGVGRGHHNPGRNAQQITATNGNTGSIPDPGDRPRDPGPAECRGCGAITDLIQGSDWCWTCVYTDPPYLDYAGRPPSSATTLGGSDRDR